MNTLSEMESELILIIVEIYYKAEIYCYIKDIVT